MGLAAVALAALAAAGCGGVSVDAKNESDSLFHERQDVKLEGGAAAVAGARPELVQWQDPVLPDSTVVAAEKLVLVEVSVDKKGQVVDTVLLQSSGDEVLDAAALVAARECVFKAARVDGLPVPSTISLPFRFHADRVR